MVLAAISTNFIIFIICYGSFTIFSGLSYMSLIKNIYYFFLTRKGAASGFINTRVGIDLFIFIIIAKSILNPDNETTEGCKTK